jgi:hypothetical protein
MVAAVSSISIFATRVRMIVRRSSHDTLCSPALTRAAKSPTWVRISDVNGRRSGVGPSFGHYVAVRSRSGPPLTAQER